jgi:hypothetical protein
MERSMVLRSWWILLASSLSVASAASAQTAPSAFVALSGDWAGEGTLFDRPARFTMRWAVRNGFALLEFTNGHVDPRDDLTPVLRAAAVYRTDPARPEGVWLDSRGVRLELSWEASDSALVATWTAPTETGRTTYRIRPGGDVHVVDEVLSGNEWRTFGTAALRRSPS